MIDLGINVVKEIAEIVFCSRTIAFIDHVLHRVAEYIGIGAPGRDQEGGLVFNYGPLKHKLRSNKSDGCRAVEFLHVPFLQSDVKHRGKPAAVTCRKTSLINGSIIDGIAVENREQAK